MQPDISNDWKARLTVAAVVALGVSAIMTQLVMLRELLAAFSGNELVLGIILGNWMLLTGVGARLGRAGGERNLQRVLAVALILVAILPLAQVCVVRIFRDVVFIRGSLVGITQVASSSFILLAPYCLLSGGILTLACRVFAESRAIGRVYFADSIGSVAGGVTFSFFLVRWFDHFALLCIPAIVCFIVAAALAFVQRYRILFAVSMLAAGGLAVVVSVVPVDAILTVMRYPEQIVVFRSNSPYGRLVITKSAGQLNFIENGVPMFSTRNEARVEETIHYVMAQRPGATNVLLISGGVSGTAKEILKYPNARVTYVELDPMIIDAGRQFIPGSLDDPRIQIVTGDGRLFIRRTPKKYDVVIVDVPDPSTSQINRFYTAEFLGEAKRVLSDGGVVSFSLGQYASYVSRELARVLACAGATVRQQFRNTLMIPGGRIFFLASDGELTTGVADRIETLGIQTTWVKRSYLTAMLAPDRLADIARAAQQPASLNLDFKPVLYSYQLAWWSSQFKAGSGFAGAVALLAVAVYIFRLRPAPLAIFASGFAACGLEVVLLLGFQILCGSVYRQIGIIVTVFMAGLAAGAWISNRSPVATANGLRNLAIAIAAFSVLLPFALRGLQHVGSLLIIQVVIAMLTFALSALVGMQFPVASRLQREDTAHIASRLYTADFIGGFLGALIPSIFVIPLLGVTATCWVTASLNAIAAMLLIRRRAP